MQLSVHKSVASRYALLMLGRTYEGQNCSVAKSLELVGERWTMLVVREVFLGNRRFDEKACSSVCATRSAPSASSTA
jgi:hypothetical protein